MSAHSPRHRQDKHRSLLLRAQLPTSLHPGCGGYIRSAAWENRGADFPRHPAASARYSKPRLADEFAPRWLATLLSAVRTVQPEASRSSSAGFRLFPRPAPVPSDMRKTTACLLQTVSAIFPKALRLFPVPEQSSLTAGGTLQTWATGFSLRL